MRDRRQKLGQGVRKNFKQHSLTIRVNVVFKKCFHVVEIVYNIFVLVHLTREELISNEEYIE